MGSVTKKAMLATVSRSLIALGVLVISSMATAIAQPSSSDEGTLRDDQRVLALEQVPANVMSTARQAAPDVFFTSAESALKDDFWVYRITGRLFRELWHVHVREDGVLMRTESDNQDD